MKELEKLHDKKYKYVFFIIKGNHDHMTAPAESIDKSQDYQHARSHQKRHNDCHYHGALEI